MSCGKRGKTFTAHPFAPPGDSRGDLHSHGLPLPANAILPGSTRAWLGHDSFVATLDPDGHILDFAGGCSATSFSLVAVNGRGELLAVTGSSLRGRTFELDITLTFLIPSETLSASPKVVLYVSLPSVLSPSPSSQPTALALPSAHTRILSIASGASHFLLLTTSGTVLAFGDNRFSQCGFSSLPSVDSLRELDFFSGLEPVEVACGAFHSAVRTRDGSLYVFGSDSEGQCGGEGEGGGTPKLVELAGDGADVEDEPEVTLVACGSFHTALVTDKGVYAAGLSESECPWRELAK